MDADSEYCQECGLKKDDVGLVEDPFQRDVHQEQVMRYLCDDCYDKLVEDI